MPSAKTQSTTKNLILGLRLVVSYCAMVINIIQIRKGMVGTGTYPPAVISMFVASTLQMFFCLAYFATSGKGKPFVAKNVVISTTLFGIWQIVSVSYTTSQRYTGRYCGPTATNRDDCSGVLKGTMGLGWSLVGLDIINVLSVISLVKSSGTWSSMLYDLPPRPRPNEDMEKAPAH